MTDDEREAILERVGDQLLLCLEQSVENITAVVFGEKRLALVPRKHEKVKAGPVLEFRLVKVEKPAVVQALAEDELNKLVDELEQPATEELRPFCACGGMRPCDCVPVTVNARD